MTATRSSATRNCVTIVGASDGNWELIPDRPPGANVFEDVPVEPMPPSAGMSNPWRNIFATGIGSEGDSLLEEVGEGSVPTSVLSIATARNDAVASPMNHFGPISATIANVK